MTPSYHCVGPATYHSNSIVMAMFSKLSSRQLLGLLSICLASAAPAAGAPFPLHAYEFQEDQSDSGTGNTPIIAEGGVVDSGLFSFDPLYPGDINEGLTLPNPQLTDVGIYSIELRMRLDTLRNETPPGPYGEDQGWIKVLDYTNNSFSQGLYIEDNIRWEGPGNEGKIEFIASGGRLDGYDYVGVSPDSVIKKNTWFHTVLTRDSSGMVVCYLDGVKMFEFQDVWDDAVLDAPNNTLRFMQPDNYALTTWPYPVIEVTQGDLDFMRLYDQALSQEEVMALFAPSPGSDFNGDGAVDALDLAIWKGSYGTEALGDANNDGLTDGIDFLLWQRELSGQVPSGLLAVPEPTPLVLVLIVLTSNWFRPRQPKLNRYAG